MTEVDPNQPTWAADPATPATPLVDLDDITPDDALLADVHRTRITTPATRVLLALVVVAAAFLGGAQVERWQHKSSSSSSASSLISQLRAARRGGGGTGTTGAGGATSGTGAGAGGFGGFGGGGGALGSGATFGTVKLVDGKNVYVQDAQGNVVKVVTDPSTTVSVTKTGKVGDLAPGSTVIVQGKQSSDGTSMSATSISQSAGLGGGGLGRFAGAGTGAGG